MKKIKQDHSNEYKENFIRKLAHQRTQSQKTNSQQSFITLSNLNGQYFNSVEKIESPLFTLGQRQDRMPLQELRQPIKTENSNLYKNNYDNFLLEKLQDIVNQLQEENQNLKKENQSLKEMLNYALIINKQNINQLNQVQKSKDTSIYEKILINRGRTKTLNDELNRSHSSFDILERNTLKNVSASINLSQYIKKNNSGQKLRIKSTEQKLKNLCYKTLRNSEL